MTKKELLDRTKNFALRSIKLVEALPNGAAGSALGRQLLRSGTSVGANYRAACRGKSRADFLNKLKIVEEECDESIYWMELIEAANLIPPAKLKPLITEANELVAIFVTAIRSTRENRKS